MTRRNILDESETDYSDDESSVFLSPEHPPDQTDYGLEYSNPARRQDSTPMRTTRTSPRKSVIQPTARKSTGRPPPQTPGRTKAPAPKSAPKPKSAKQPAPAQRSPRKAGPKPNSDNQPSTSATGARRRKQKKPSNFMQRELNFIREVVKLQQLTGFLVPKLPFGRLVREIIQSYTMQVAYITPEALMALQESAEMYITQQLADAYLLTKHRGRVTLMPRDMELLRMLRAST